MNSASDDELVRLLARVAGQGADGEVALRQLYDRTSPRLYGLALRVLGNAEWAEDALQDAYLQIWRSAGDFRVQLSPPLAWMGLIVRSRALDFRRRRSAERLDDAQPLDDDLADALGDDADGPEAHGAASQAARALHDCLRRLDARQREVVSLAYLRDLSHAELAAQLRLPLGTVKTWIRRGLAQLRLCMGRFA